ncbi:MAG: NAD-dependent epimerase/dehydratase family protein [Nitrospiraceae bacterium]|nr:MAG: NAD-dependent epimerase/dehydratase family protein [Nitrospiraceae bacterium]
MKALVTGATGFIGSHLAEALLKRGYEVSCLVRKTSNPAWLDALDVKRVGGDCSDKSSLLDCVKGQDYVFHLAGLTKAVCKERFYSINAKGTANLIEAVAENNPGIKRFVYLSSLSAFGPQTGGRLPKEDEIPHPVSDYGKSKLEGENAVFRHAGRIPATVLRPSVVYGPRDREFFWFFRIIERGLIPYWGDGHTSLIYVDDLVNAIILAACSNGAAGKTYFISDGELHSNAEIIKEIASSLDVKAVRIRLPKSFLRIIGYFSDRISKMVGKNTIVNRDKIKEIMYPEWVCDISKARSEFCFKPGVDMKKGIKWTADWYRIHKWL